MQRGPERRPPQRRLNLAQPARHAAAAASRRSVWLAGSGITSQDSIPPHPILSITQNDDVLSQKRQSASGLRRESCSEEDPPQILTGSRSRIIIGWTNCYFHIPPQARYSGWRKEGKCGQKLTEPTVYGLSRGFYSCFSRCGAPFCPQRLRG